MLEGLGMKLPIIQAPMAGVSTPALAAAVSNAGGLGSIGIGASDVAGARAMIDETFAQTDRPFNVNVFVHGAAVQDPEREAAWLAALEPVFAEFGATPPAGLRVIYKSFSDDPEMLSLLVEKKPAVVSFHFGLPPAETITALKDAGIRLLATATSLAEAETAEAAGLDAVIAQGIEAGGHRGVFDPLAVDDGLGTFALTRLLVRKTGIPVIAAGGIMDGAGITAARDLGAVAAQLGTAFIACPESAADDAYRAALKGPGAFHTRLTNRDFRSTGTCACQPVHGTGGNIASRNHAARLSHCLRCRKGPSRRRQSLRRGRLRCAMGGARRAARARHARRGAYGNARA